MANLALMVPKANKYISRTNAERSKAGCQKMPTSVGMMRPRTNNSGMK